MRFVKTASPAASSCLPVSLTAGYKAEASGDNPGDQDPKAVSILRKFPGPEYTFVLAGFLKILTIGSLAQTAPVDAARTAFGHISPYLMIPVGLLMCWLAKMAVDFGLHENNKFLGAMVAFLVLTYFGIYRLLFRYSPSVEYIRQPQPTSSAPMAQLRARLGDRDVSGLSIRDTRSYDPQRLGQDNDLSYYEGRYPSQIRQDQRAAELAAQIPAGMLGDDSDGSLRKNRAYRGYDAVGSEDGFGAAVSQEELLRRNPLRQQARMAPGMHGSYGYGANMDWR